MLLSIDGKPVPQNTGINFDKSLFSQYPKAKFILDNLKPESNIGWLDFEGGEPPTYEGLMMWAQMILPMYKRQEVTHYIGTVEMRRACAKLCNREGNPKAQYITHEVLQAINEERSRRSKRQVAEAYYKSQGKGYIIVDSIPQTDYAGKILHNTPNGVGMEFGRFRGLTLHTRRMLDGLPLNTPSIFATRSKV